MPLWTAIVLLWISLASSKDSDEWFVVDINDWELDEKSDFLVDENFLRIPPKESVKSKSSQHTVPAAQKTKTVPVKTDTPKHDDALHGTKTAASKNKLASNDIQKELASEDLLLHNNVGHVPPRQPPQRHADKQSDVVANQHKKVDSSSSNNQQNVLPPATSDIECDQENDVDCLFRSEELIPIQTKSSAKTAKSVPVTTNRDAKLSQAVKSRTNEVPKSEKAKIKSQPTTRVRVTSNIGGKESDSKKSKHSPFVRRLLQYINDFRPEPELPVTEITESENEHPKSSEGNDEKSVDFIARVIDPSVIVEDVDDVDDTSYVLQEGDEFADEDDVSRVRRAANDDDLESSGGGPDVSPNITIPTIPDPTFTVKLNVTLETQYTNGTSPPENFTKTYQKLFEEKLNRIFEQFPGFVKVDVKKVLLDENGRIKAQYELLLKLGAKEKKKERLQLLLPTMLKVNNITVKGDPVYKPSTRDILNKTVEKVFNDTCHAKDACPDGYYNCETIGNFSRCTHRCYSTNQEKLCQNGAKCKLSDSFEPICSCKRSFTGRFCEKAKTSSDTGLTTPEIIGVSTGAIIVLAALISCCLFLLCCRRKSDKNMDYTYFGDENQPLEGYSDQSSALGIRPVYIDRPHISTAPLDIFSFSRSHDSSEDV
ncbi:uncharacterized protein LOC121387658 [Gigantopelta aegis]|uniref:uncharacterized protein LOC121387658 n=1 Tax=Gigantopelta aegis TaxID=1735272 RepID=UPI001B88A9F2|nr:uncharacterized protein LOC121387658 [Gigantopelta aegis]